MGSPLENSTIYLEGLARGNNSIVIKPRVVVYPKGISRSPLSPVVPEEFAGDYKEACTVFADSEKASAALSRRILDFVSSIDGVLDFKALD